MCDCKQFGDCFGDCGKDTGEVIPDWAKIKAYRETYPRDTRRDSDILENWPYFATSMKALARRIARDDTPPVSQELLIWREAMARVCEADNCDISRPYRTDAPEKYRAGVFDSNFHKEGSSYLLITLALQNFGKD